VGDPASRALLEAGFLGVTEPEFLLSGRANEPVVRFHRDGTEPLLPDADLVMFDVTIETTTGLTANTGVQTLSGDDLPSWLSGLADEFRGWSGTKTWESLEHDATIVATHDGVGHVSLLVTLRGPRGYEPGAWQASVTLSVDAGEDMARLARAATAFLA
jgi:hypothetical protein